MERTHAQKVAFNVVSGLFYQFVIIALGFLMPRLYLVNFGSAVNGVLSTVKQIFAYLWLLEAGVGLATTQALYGPLAKDDHTSINSILSATRRCYLRTGVIYGVVVLLIAVVYSFAAADALSPVIVFSIVLLNGIPSVLSYLFLGKYRLLLEADGKNYVIHNAETVAQLAISVGKLAALLIFENLILVQAVYCVCAIFQLIYLYRYTRRSYPWLNVKAPPNMGAIAQRNSVLLHQISGVIFNNTDIILLSILCDFKVVSVYTIYNLFFSQIQTLLSTITSSITFFLGQLFQRDRRQFIQYYDAYETLYIMGTFFIYTMMGLFLLPVIRLYTKNVTDINYIDAPLLLLFVGMNLLSCGKLPSNHVVNFSGQFQETRHHAIIEAAINLTVSVAAICFWGIYGGLFGTIAALAYRGIVTVAYSNRRLLGRSAWYTYRRWLCNGLVCAAALLLLGLHAQLSFPRLLLRLCIAAPPVALAFLAVNAVSERSVFRFLRNWLKGHLRK